MTITENDLTAALRALNDELNPSPEDGEFTCINYAAANNMTRDKAKYILEKGVKDRKVTRRVINNTVYYKKV